MVVSVPPIAIVVPAPVANRLEVSASVTRGVAVAAETFDGAIEMPFGVLDTIAAVAPAPRLCGDRHAA
jgi:hypothetical protein